MLSLADIQSMLRREQTNPGLEEIPETFNHEYEMLVNNPEIGEFKKTIIELKEKIFFERKNKILKSCMGPQPKEKLENTTTQEQTLNQEIITLINKYMTDKTKNNKKTKKHSKTTNKKETPKTSDDLVKVKFLKGMPEIVGVDQKNYGPYESGETANLPKKNVEILIKNQIAQEIN